jgi:membrane associated rhomboid family serine protease
MFLPIGDENPREKTPYVNYALLGANVLAFFLFCFPTPDRAFLSQWALVPARQEWYTFLTSMFLHANLMHLVGNMLFLWIFGDNVEDRLGHLGYAVFYAAAGLAAALLHLLTLPAEVPFLAAHGVPVREIPMLGASGAISGVIGAYVVFFPRHRVKMLLWLWFYYDVLLIPAFWWIGIWFVEQIIFATQGWSGVAYAAHIGGFLAGAAVGGVVRTVLAGFRPSARVPEEIREPSRTPDRRRPFITLEDDPGIEYIDEPEDRYAVLRLSDELHSVSRIAEVAGEVTREDPRDVARRLEATRGMIVKGVSRIAAERIQKDLHLQGIPAAIIVYNRSNFPPTPVSVEGVSWDDRSLRLRAGAEVLSVPWSAPFLYVGARVGRFTFIDFFVNRRAAYRVPAQADVPLVEVDPRERAETPSDLPGFARAILEYRSGAALNEGVRVLAHHGAWGWLAFRSFSDYDDYVFWVYNLILSTVPLHKA